MCKPVHSLVKMGCATVNNKVNYLNPNESILVVLQRNENKAQSESSPVQRFHFFAFRSNDHAVCYKCSTLTPVDVRNVPNFTWRNLKQLLCDITGSICFRCLLFHSVMLLLI